MKKKNGLWVRLITVIVVAVNSCFMIMGKPLLPFDSEEITMGISVAALLISETVNHWKNNSYTQGAIEADAYLESRKIRLKYLNKKG